MMPAAGGPRPEVFQVDRGWSSLFPQFFTVFSKEDESLLEESSSLLDFRTLRFLRFFWSILSEVETSR